MESDRQPGVQSGGHDPLVWIGLELLLYFMPFVIGWFIAYIVSPVVNWLEKRLKIVKKLSSALVIILVLAAVVLLLYWAGSRLFQEVAALVTDMPAYIGN